jgi:hypothetical protein
MIPFQVDPFDRVKLSRRVEIKKEELTLNPEEAPPLRRGIEGLT